MSTGQSDRDNSRFVSSEQKLISVDVETKIHFVGDTQWNSFGPYSWYKYI